MVLRIQATKSSYDAFQNFLQICKDLDAVKDDKSSDIGKQLLTKIKCTMRDRAPSEIHWHNMLRKYKETILPEMTENWEQLDEHEQADMLKVKSLFCGLHSYVQQAQVIRR